VNPYENISETRRAVDDVVLILRFPASSLPSARQGKKVPCHAPEIHLQAVDFSGYRAGIKKIFPFFPCRQGKLRCPGRGSQRVRRSLQSPGPGPIVPLIAETGGQNAMIVDSSALAEQVVADLLTSAFDSAGAARRRASCMCRPTSPTTCWRCWRAQWRNW